MGAGNGVELCEVQLYVATNLAKSSLSSRVAGVWSTDLGAWADYRAGEAMTLSAWASMRWATFLGAPPVRCGLACAARLVRRRHDMLKGIEPLGEPARAPVAPQKHGRHVDPGVASSRTPS